MLDLLVNQLLKMGIDATVSAASSEEAEIFPDKFTCRASWLPRVLLLVGIPIFIAATNLFLKDPDESYLAILPALLTLGFIVAAVHYWTLKIEAEGTTLTFGSAVRRKRAIQLSQPFEFEFEPYQSMLKITQDRTKLVINHYYDGHKTLLKWIVWIANTEDPAEQVVDDQSPTCHGVDA